MRRRVSTDLRPTAGRAASVSRRATSSASPPLSARPCAPKLLRSRAALRSRVHRCCPSRAARRCRSAHAPALPARPRSTPGLRRRTAAARPPRALQSWPRCVGLAPRTSPLSPPLSAWPRASKLLRSRAPKSAAAAPRAQHRLGLEPRRFRAPSVPGLLARHRACAEERPPHVRPRCSHLAPHEIIRRRLRPRAPSASRLASIHVAPPRSACFAATQGARIRRSRPVPRAHLAAFHVGQTRDTAQQRQRSVGVARVPVARSTQVLGGGARSFEPASTRRYAVATPAVCRFPGVGGARHRPRLPPGRKPAPARASHYLSTK
ncbi:hypothetical protein B0H15DRAFT_871398, partial [Mycena belliarum]